MAVLAPVGRLGADGASAACLSARFPQVSPGAPGCRPAPVPRARCPPVAPCRVPPCRVPPCRVPRCRRERLPRQLWNTRASGKNEDVRERLPSGPGG